MRQQVLPQAGGCLASPGHVPLTAVEAGWDPLRGAARPWLPWQRSWETGMRISWPYPGPGGFARTRRGDGVRLTREQVCGWPRHGWGLSRGAGEGVFGHAGAQAIPSGAPGPSPLTLKSLMLAPKLILPMFSRSTSRVSPALPVTCSAVCLSRSSVPWYSCSHRVGTAAPCLDPTAPVAAGSLPALHPAACSPRTSPGLPSTPRGDKCGPEGYPTKAQCGAQHPGCPKALAGHGPTAGRSHSPPERPGQGQACSRSLTFCSIT